MRSAPCLMFASSETVILVDLHNRRRPLLCHRAYARQAGCKCIGPNVPRTPMCVLPIICVYSVLSGPPAAADMNKFINFKGLRIYGLLTDLIQFKFYSYDPTTNQFCFDETIIINNKRTDASSDMMDGPYFSPRPLFRVDFLPQFPIRSSVLFCRHIESVCAQI